MCNPNDEPIATNKSIPSHERLKLGAAFHRVEAFQAHSHQVVPSPGFRFMVLGAGCPWAPGAGGANVRQDHLLTDQTQVAPATRGTRVVVKGLTAILGTQKRRLGLGQGVRRGVPRRSPEIVPEGGVSQPNFVA
jgi:hypothetical protein